jgi:hypothetical protein
VGENGVVLKYIPPPVSVIDDGVLLPKEIVLRQNYPNPFNPTTSIRYTMSSKQFVTLKVYDVLGDEIATLVDEEKSAGSFEVEFTINNLQFTINKRCVFLSTKIW